MTCQLNEADEKCYDSSRMSDKSNLIKVIILNIEFKISSDLIIKDLRYDFIVDTSI